jgi:hypothetical protein
VIVNNSTNINKTKNNLSSQLIEHKIMTYDIGNLNPGLVRVMVFIATFNNISVISWQSVSLVEESGVPGENHQPATSH